MPRIEVVHRTGGDAADAKFAATGMIQTERQVFGLAREFLGRSERGAAS